jgi:hypothetical protein
VIKELEEIISVLTNYMEKEITGIEKDEFTLTNSIATFEIAKDQIKLVEWHKNKTESLEKGKQKNEKEPNEV